MSSPLQNLTRRRAIRTGLSVASLASVAGCQQLGIDGSSSDDEDEDDESDGEESDDEPALLVDEGFDDSKPDDWAVVDEAVWGAEIPDRDRGSERALRLTEAAKRQLGGGFYDRGFETDSGFVVEFDLYVDGGTGADGIALFAVDGDAVSASNVDLGKRGGGLGYTQGQRDFEDIDGLSNAYLGVGFDAIGNFSKENDNEIGGTLDQQPESVALRGEGDGQDGYAYLTHESVAEYGGVQGGWRRAIVTLEPTGPGLDIAVDMSWDGGGTVEPVLKHTYETPPPSSLKFGFSGATGGKTNVHAVDNVRIRRP